MCWSALAGEPDVIEINDAPCDDRTPKMLRNRIQIVKPDHTPASLPLEVRLLVRGETAPRVVLADVKPLAWPENISDDFFWEPLPAGSRAVSATDAGIETGPEHDP
jgi:hypothetical protein